MKYSNTAATEDTDEPEREYYDEHNYDRLPGYILEINNDVYDDTETYNEAISDNDISDDPVNIVLSFKADTSDEKKVNVAQVASADVPDQDTPEKYINTDRDTLDRVINTPVYYMDTSVYNKINKIRGSYLI